jgi:hypothetical protein
MAMLEAYEEIRESKGITMSVENRREVNGLEDSAASALVLAVLDLQSDASGFSEGFVDTSVLHGGALYDIG